MRRTLLVLSALALVAALPLPAAADVRPVPERVDEAAAGPRARTWDGPSEGTVQVLVRLRAEPLTRTRARGQVGTAQAAQARRVAVQQDGFVARAERTTSARELRGARGQRSLRLRNVLNGVFLEVDAADVDRLLADPEVESVSRVRDYERHLPDTVPYVFDGDADNGRTTSPTAGAGVVVAVLDSGIDYTHASLGGPGTVEDFLAAYGADGGGNPNPSSSANRTIDPTYFPTEKVVDGYDFVGEFWPDGPLTPNPNPIDIEGHGTHVADIIAGVGEAPGVAPAAALYGIKVCASFAPSCSGVALLAGMDYALSPSGDPELSDAADIINMSLGADWGSPFDDDLSLAVENASLLNVLTVSSAGNGGDKPFISGTPSSASSALSVAQTATPSAVLSQLELTADEEEGRFADIVFQSWSAPQAETIEAPATYGVGANTLGCEPFPAGSLEGLVVLVDRGECNFTLKAANAEDAGAVMTLVGLVDASAPFDGGDGGDRPADGSFDTPAYMIDRGTADIIRVAEDEERTIIARIDPDAGLPLIGSVVGSSSRGPAMGTAQLKPEIGAPGASVSAVAGSGDERSAFGGTSGASPMVAGAAAVLRSDRFGGLDPTPAELKSLLMNAADPEVYLGPDLPDAPGTLAPISRIGAGELRIEPALTAPAAAWDAENPANGAALAFGHLDVTGAEVELTRTVTVRNYSDDEVTYAIAATPRYDGRDALTVETPAEITVPGGSDATFEVTLTIDGAALPAWTLNSGSRGDSGPSLTAVELDGHVTLTNEGSTLQLPFHVLPRKSGDVVASDDELVFDGDEARVDLTNTGIGTATVDSYTLLATSPRDGGPAVPGAGQPVLDLAAFGARTEEVDFCDAGFLTTFMVTTHDRITKSVSPTLFELAIDTTGDGEVDYYVVNLDLQLGALGDGRNLTWVEDVATGDLDAFFFTDHGVLSTNTGLTVCGEQLGLDAGDLGETELTIDVAAVDFYYSESLTDLIEGVAYVPGGERVIGSDHDIAPGATETLEAIDTGEEGVGEGLLVVLDADRGATRGGAPEGNESLLLPAVFDEGEDPDPDPDPEPAVRVSGQNRLQTAVAISQATFDDGEADTVILARADIAPDALAGTPLAIAANGPMLLTGSNALADVTADEIERVLPEGGTVHLLGGTGALDDAVEEAVVALGYDVVRVFGRTRFQTAVAIAELLGDPGTLLITTGVTFPDALAAGAAAGHVGGAVLLTTSDAPHPAVDAYLADNPEHEVYAVGGPAARAYPAATDVFGSTREGTAVAVAERFFDDPAVVGFARRDQFPDALAGGSHSGRLGGPILLTPTTALHPAPSAYLCATGSTETAFVYGGTSAISADTFEAIAARVRGEGCGDA
jgi:subtilisin family serine protease